MKLDNLRQLVKEELNSALEDLKNTPLKNMNGGTYEIEYMTQADGGGGDMGKTITATVTKNEFIEGMDLSPSNFWKGIARDAANFPIYKVTKVTRV